MSATHAPNWKQQFPSWPDDITALATELEALGFTDESWGNDACPRFDKKIGDTLIAVWIDAIDIDQRDSQCVNRFAVCSGSSENGEPIKLVGSSTHSWADVLNTINTIIAESKPCVTK